MLESRLAVGCLLVGAWLGACSSGAKNQFDCAVGHADCSCNADGSCADGLVCNNRRQCVMPGGAGRAGAGSATGGSANGGEANGGTGGANANRGGKGGKRGGHDGAGSGGDSAGDGTSGETGGVADDAGGMSNGAGQSGGGTGGTTGGSGGNGGMGAMSGTPGLGGTSGATSAGGAGNGGFGGNAQAGMSGNCTEITVPSTMAIRNLTEAPDYVDYEYKINAIGLSAGPNSADLFVLDFYGPGRGYDGDLTGSFTLGTDEDANYETCARCVLVDQDSGNDAETLYFAESGALAIADDSDQLNGFPAATLTDVTLVEVTIDQDTHHSTPVDGGRCVHVTSAGVSFPADWTCDPGAYSANDGCDCGCGVPDGDCMRASKNVCDTCNCPGDGGDCSQSSVSPTNNAVCE